MKKTNTNSKKDAQKDVIVVDEDVLDNLEQNVYDDDAKIPSERKSEKKFDLEQLKPSFVERYKHLLGEKEYQKFKEYSSKYIKKTIRVNTLKIGIDKLKMRLEKDWILDQVPWCKEGFWIKYKHGERFDVGNIPEHQLGYIYIQDAASMIPPVVLNPQPGEQILDLCAAPGSKTTQIAQYMNNEGLLIANDFQGKRLSALGLNTQRCGVRNILITKMDGERLGETEMFDKILVDAPCSGTGTIRRNYKIIEMWSPHLVTKLSGIQYKLLSNAYKALKPGGILVYSTCTLEPEENEKVVSRLLENNVSADLEEIKLNIKRSPAITEFDGKKYDERVSKCLRIYPQDNDSEGFFVAKITKKDEQ